MNHPNRLEPISAAETLPRQTPKRDFGSVLAEHLGGAFSKGASIVSRALGNIPLLSTAVSGVTSVGQLVSGGAPVRGIRWIGSNVGPGGLDDSLAHDLVQRIESGGELSPGEYLVLQRAIQQENQQYTAVSNILKVRADSAKAAINNIR